MADIHNDRIQKFHLPVHFVSLCPSATIHLPPPPKGLCWVTEWGSPGFGTSAPIGQFSFPLGISVDSAGGVYVADSNNNRIQVFK